MAYIGLIIPGIIEDVHIALIEFLIEFLNRDYIFIYFRLLRLDLLERGVIIILVMIFELFFYCFSISNYKVIISNYFDCT